MIEVIGQIESKNDFIHFLNLCLKDFEKNPNGWKNKTIPEFLEQMASGIEDYSICPANHIKWNTVDFKVLAQII